MVAMTGLSGTGKSTVAELIGRSDRRDGPLIRSGAKSLAGVEGPAPSAWKEGLYGPEWTERTYPRLTELASEMLATGASVVLDASFLERAQRQLAAETAAKAGATLIFVETTCDEDVVLKRIAARQASGRSISDATIEIHRRQRAEIEERSNATA